VLLAKPRVVEWPDDEFELTLELIDSFELIDSLALSLGSASGTVLVRRLADLDLVIDSWMEMVFLGRSCELPLSMYLDRLVESELEEELETVDSEDLLSSEIGSCLNKKRQIISFVKSTHIHLSRTLHNFNYIKF